MTSRSSVIRPSVGVMISQVAVHGYRSIRNLVMDLGRITVVTGCHSQ
ncbi:hypothetical protein [Cutibacterium avidum]|nr:hypothetical protein [Cutibacterium avidum]ERF57373.1 Putative ATPase [Cutibacterium avidum TM16]MBS6259863.1 hypothetical protein [Propionibacterium sp.]MCO6657068.1 hypothetical protein [Cutibacterium avidum]MCO6663165.1 hypothetical protein [Cutibacterium avidum]MCO6677414.1 hypothetical protein [Cutibacterium avidum]